MAGSDPECTAKGIPEHLHQMDRDSDPVFEPAELLFRRFLLERADLTAAISFNRMSVNRAKYCESPEDTLWNDIDGGKYDGYGVISFPVEALEESWEHPSSEQNPVTFDLRPEHKPNQCNYPHSEVVVYEFHREQESLRPLDKIKPTSVKLQIREHLQRHVRVVLPPERDGDNLPIQ